MILRIGWGVGALIAVLLSFSVYFFGLISLSRTVAAILLLVGLWTVFVGLFAADPKDKYYYTGWGVVLAFLSLFDFVPPGFAVGILLIAIVGLIVIFYFGGRSGHAYAATAGPPTTSGGAPAAT